MSIDYGYTFHNFHFFGEVAADKNYNRATVDGLLISVDPKVDLSFFYRSISSKYQAINGNAFTENSNPGNENGFYAACSIRPHQALRLDAYIDIFKFPWLKYQVDAPSYGKELFTQLTYSPNKQVEIYTRYRIGSSLLNRGGADAIMNSPEMIPKQDWRTQLNCQLNRNISVRSRFELVWYDKKDMNGSSGFLGLFDCIVNPSMKPYSVAIRLQFFETGDYNSRLYAYENDVLYSYSIPVFFDKGCRYYLNLNYQLNKRLSCWLKWAQTIYKDKHSIGSGLDEINGNSKSELRFQFALYL